MHSTTHVDVPAHVIEDTPFLDEVPLHSFFGTGVVVSIPKGKWEVVTADDLEKAEPKIQPGDIVIVNTGWHRYYGDNAKYYAYSPGFYKEAGEWFAERGVKTVGTDTQALDHPLATAIGPHGPGAPDGLLPWACAEYKAETGHDVLQDFPEWEPCHRALLSRGIVGFENVGGDIDKVTGKRVTFAAFPWRWVKGDGCIIRLVAMLTQPAGSASSRGRHDEGESPRRRRALQPAQPFRLPARSRLQGWDASDSSNFWVGLSHFLPGGNTSHEATPLEKVYVVIRGEIGQRRQPRTVLGDRRTGSVRGVGIEVNGVAARRGRAGRWSMRRRVGAPGAQWPGRLRHPARSRATIGRSSTSARPGTTRGRARRRRVRSP